MKRGCHADAAAILRAERLVERTEVCGHLPTSAQAAELLRQLAILVRIAKRLHLERADPNRPAASCATCAWIAREYGAEVIG